MKEIKDEDVKRLKSIWCGMKSRCYDKKSHGYKWYGAKGIEMCEIWKKDFWHFFFWAIEHGYKNELTIDRIDSKKGYTPMNCRWADWETQANNKESVKKYKIKGEIHTLREWCNIYNISIHLVRNRLKYGWSLEKSLEKNKRKLARGNYLYEGKQYELVELCKKLNKKYRLVYARLQAGWNLDEALNTPVRKR